MFYFFNHDVRKMNLMRTTFLAFQQAAPQFYSPTHEFFPFQLFKEVSFLNTHHWEGPLHLVM